MRYRLIDGEVALPLANTEYSWTIPEGARDWELKLDNPAATWRWSTVQGRVAGGDGHPMAVGSSLNSTSVSHAKQVIYFASSQAGVNAHFASSVPVVR